MNKYLIIFLFFCYSVSAEIVQTEGTYMITEDISRKEGCALAKQRAELAAREKVLGRTISSEEIENCTEVDGKTKCERHQFFLSSFNGDITGVRQIKKELIPKKIENSDEEIFICKIKIEADVIKSEHNLDASFDFNVKLNEKNFREGEKLKMDIEINKPLYFTIFQFLPYEEKDYQVHKLFPNELEKNNFVESNNFSLPVNAKYEIYFPKNIDKKSVDEYLIFLASENNINLLDKYAKIEDFKKAYIREKNLKFVYKSYTIYK